MFSVVCKIFLIIIIIKYAANPLPTASDERSCPNRTSYMINFNFSLSLLF